MKKLLSVIVVLLLALVLVGCNEDTLDNFGTPTNESLQQQIDDLQAQVDELETSLETILGVLTLIDNDFEARIDELETLPDNIENIEEYLNWLEQVVQDDQQRISELEQQNNGYTREEVEQIIDALLKDLVEIKYTDSDELDVEYNEQTKIFTVIEYNSQGEIFDVDEYTLQDIIDILLDN